MVRGRPVDLAELSPERLRRALDGGAEHVRPLVAALTPHVQVRIARVLHRHRGRAAGRTLRQEVDDLSQETFVELFEHGARTLRSWDPSRGLPLASFVQVVAERVTLSVLRSGRRSPWTEDPVEDAGADLAPDSGTRPDRRVASREALVQVLERLKQELSPRGWELFHALFVEEREVPAICEAFAMQPDAVYAWRSRLGKRIRALAAEIEPPSDPRLPGRTPLKERRG